jgi:hypothetical protein
MKRFLLIMLLVLNISCARRIAMQSPAIYSEEWGENGVVIFKSDMADFIHERYLYKIRWLGLTAAEVELENLGIENYRGRDCYHIVIKARTNRVLNFIFKVRDEFHSYIDSETLKPLAYIVKRREGGYRSETETIFDYDKGKLTHRSLLNGSSKELDLEPDYEDFVSCFYRFRTSEFDKDFYSFKIIHRTKVWRVDIEIIKKGFLEIRGHGSPKVILAKITALSGEEKAKGIAWVWFSGDNRKVPLLGQFNIDIPIVGTVRAALEP